MSETPTLIAEITGNVTNQEMLIFGDDSNPVYGGGGLEAGIDIVLGTATTADVTITDAAGRTLYTETSITASAAQAPSARAVRGPIMVTVANISNAEHTLDVLVGIRK